MVAKNPGIFFQLDPSLPGTVLDLTSSKDKWMGTLFNFVHWILTATRLQVALLRRSQLGSSNRSVRISSFSSRFFNSPSPLRADRWIWSCERFFANLRRKCKSDGWKIWQMARDPLYKSPAYFERCFKIWFLMRDAMLSPGWFLRPWSYFQKIAAWENGLFTAKSGDGGGSSVGGIFQEQLIVVVMDPIFLDGWTDLVKKKRRRTGWWSVWLTTCEAFNPSSDMTGHYTSQELSKWNNLRNMRVHIFSSSSSFPKKKYTADDGGDGGKKHLLPFCLLKKPFIFFHFKLDIIW